MITVLVKRVRGEAVAIYGPNSFYHWVLHNLWLVLSSICQGLQVSWDTIQAKQDTPIDSIDFNQPCTFGILKLPPMIIDDTTKYVLLNLAAYEACPDSVTDFGMTSYICFMDSLIDNAEDVKVLRSKGILLNFLGSDQQVADIFNEIATELVPSPHVYVEVKTRIQKHHRNSMKIWMAEWHHTYILGAFGLSLLSLLQFWLLL
ncbi:putative UPF0481 protein [Camellia lanceoleosa]|uniref:UPF0481 protein n=1 Tax=Camellia lanceoleosa TaxID=1840588 RepID=A0ACC0G9H7_9ERIC|nr:putative UPF0481 protein [Camellia lanceoleosa]